MDCAKIDALMTPYMDYTLSEADAKVLSAHLQVCEICRADFELYDQIMTGFSDMPLVEAPEGLEVAVMAQVAALGEDYHRVEAACTEKVLLMAFGLTLALLSLAAAFGFPLESGMLGAYIYLPNMTLLLESASVMLYESAAAFAAVMASFEAAASRLTPLTWELQAALFVIVMALVVTQMHMYRNEKVESE